MRCFTLGRVPPKIAWRCLLAAGGLGLVTGGRGQDMNIGVRSSVVDRIPGKGSIPVVHGKLYGMLPPYFVTSDEKLVKPADPGLMAALVARELERNGFRRVTQGHLPDIVITTHYGRGWLRNPYLAGAGTETPSGYSGVAGVDAPTVTITGTAEQLFKEAGIGYEQKLQKAQFEKLYIRVTAWAYPMNPKSKARMLWHTTMVADDPDHRDLNQVASEMLAAGGAYFDKDVKEEEIDFYRPVPEGRVYVGTPEVVGSSPSRDK